MTDKQRFGNITEAKGLSLEAFAKASKTLQQQMTAVGSRMKIEQQLDILPPPKKVGNKIFGQSLREYIVIFDDFLQWQATGKMATNSHKPAIILRCSGCNLPWAKLHNGYLTIESRHHGQKHTNVITIDELVQLSTR